MHPSNLQQPQHLSTTNSASSSLTSPAASVVVSRHRKRSWSEENTIREEEEGFLEAQQRTMMRSSSGGSDDHSYLHNHTTEEEPSSQQAQFRAYAAGSGSAQAVRTGPLYLAVILFFTIPLFIMSVVSTTKIPKPPNMDGDPRVAQSHNVETSIRRDSTMLQSNNHAHQYAQQPQQSAQQQESVHRQDLPQQHYRGRPYAWQMRPGGVAAFDSVTTVHETPTARCSLGTHHDQQQPQLLFESLDVIVVAMVDKATDTWLVWEDSDQVRFLAGTVQTIHEAPWAAACRLVQSTANNHTSCASTTISLDAYGLPLGLVPSSQASEWTFLGKSRTMMEHQGPLVFSYLYTTLALESLPPARRYDRATLVQAWQSAKFVDLTHAHTASLALHTTTPLQQQPRLFG